jgi:hypothetical protein
VLEALGGHGEDDMLVEASDCASPARSGAMQQWDEGMAVRHQFHSRRSDDRVGSRAKRKESGVSEAGACGGGLGAEGTGRGAAGTGRTSPISSWRRLSRGNLDDGRTEA